MKLLHAMKAVLHKQSFQPTWLGVVVSPVFIVRRGLYRGIKEFAPLIEGDVLDFGCGSKPYENLFVNAKTYVGCDVEVSGHRHADSKVDRFYDGRTLPFVDARYDAVVSFETFEHIFNLPEILEEIRRVTKADGYLLVTVPFAWDEHEIPFDFARYTSFGITHLLGNAGFEILHVRKTTTYILTVFQMLIAYLHQHVLPRNRLAYAFQVLLLFPLNLCALAFDAVLPKKYGYFCNTLVLARKRPQHAGSHGTA